MIKKVISNFLILIVGVLLFSCNPQYKIKPRFVELSDKKDSAEDISRINLIKSLDYSDFKEGRLSNEKIAVNYRLLQPKNADKKKKHPLILVFHGSGAIGTNNTSQMGVLSKMWLLPEYREKFSVFVLSPQFPVRSSNYHLDKIRNVQVSESNEYLDLVLKSVDSLSKTSNIDESRIYVIGFSMGGSTVMNAISKRPDLFAAAINVSGISDFSNMENLKNLPIRIIHGGLDTDNRPESNVKFYNEMKDVGNIFFFKYKDRYHNNILSSEAVASIAEWLSLEKLKKRK